MLDSYVLIEVCRQLAYIDKKSGGKSKVIFTVNLGHYSCASVSDALNLQLEFKRFKLQPYVVRYKFDSQTFARENLEVDNDFRHEPQLEDYWENYVDEFEV